MAELPLNHYEGELSHLGEHTCEVECLLRK
jgi:hypothetical protein